MKKLVSLTLVLAMMFSLGASAQAADISTESMATIVNEYDIYVRQKDTAQGEYSVMSVDSTEEKTIEELYLERAALSEEELVAQFGYSKEQIAILKSYDGSAIEDNQQLRALSATCSLNMDPYMCGTNRTGIKVTWSWSSKPVAITITKDNAFAVAWNCVDDNGNRDKEGVLNPTLSYIWTDYYDINDTRKVTSEMDDFTYDGYESAAFGTFARGIDDAAASDAPYWAKCGYALIVVDAEGDYNLMKTHFQVVFYEELKRVNIANNIDVSYNLATSTIEVSFNSAVGTTPNNAKVDDVSGSVYAN